MEHPQLYCGMAEARHGVPRSGEAGQGFQWSNKEEGAKMLKPKDEGAAKALEKVWKHASNLGRGGVIVWEVIEKATGATRDESKTKSLVAKLKRRMERERGITLWSTPGVGYRLCTAAEQLVECSERRSRRAARQLRKGIEHVAAIPDGDLTSHQRTVRTQRVESNRRALRQVRASRKADAAFLKPTNGSRPFR